MPSASVTAKIASISFRVTTSSIDVGLLGADRLIKTVPERENGKIRRLPSGRHPALTAAPPLA